LDLNLGDAPKGEVVEYIVKKSITSIVLTKSINNDKLDILLGILLRN